MKELNAVRDEIKSFKDVAVEARKQVHGNVYLQVNGAEFVVRVDSKGGRFVREGSAVKWVS